jgi:hypothetical protein
MAPEPIQLTGGTAEPMGFGVSRATGAAPAPPSLPIAPAPSLDQRPAGPSAVAAMEPPAALPDLPTLGVQEGDPLASDLPAMPSQAPDPASASALDTSATAASAAVAADPIPDLPPSPSTTGPDMTEPIRSRPEPTPEVEVAAPAIEDPAPPALATPEPPPSIEAPALPALEMPDPTAIEAPAPAPTPAPASDPGLPSVAPEPAAAPEPVSEPGLPSLPALPMEAAALQPAGPAMPPLPGDEPPAPAAEELMAAPSPAPEMGMAPEPSASPSPPTAADAARDTTLGGALDPAAPAGNGGETILPETMRREVEDVARAYQRDVINQRSQIREPMRQGATPLGAGPLNLPGGVPSLIGPPLPSGGETSPSESRIELPRVPSPTEPRPIRSIPVPEEFVPLKPRAWTPSRKVWAAAATCHTPLYFQDAPLERYGLGVEQALGPHYGRFASIPLDDPTQSNQRQQLLQPFWSVGKFGAQIALWPVNMIFNPPWESEYDLGYWRPGDRVPPDTLYWPLTGVGPPFRGKKY